jgi:hypothetical protein
MDVEDVNVIFAASADRLLKNAHLLRCAANLVAQRI